jgi:transcriptional regulator with XRE-family HTH domain
VSAHFGQCFQAFLREKKITQTEAAAALRWSQNTVSYYCNTAKPPRPHVLAHIAAVLGFQFGAVGRDGSPGRPPSKPTSLVILIEAKNLRRAADKLVDEAEKLRAAADALEKTART